MTFGKKTALAAAMTTAAVMFLPQMASARFEAKMYAVTVWNAGCAGSTRGTWDDMVDAWYDEITDAGLRDLRLVRERPLRRRLLPRRLASWTARSPTAGSPTASVVSFGADTTRLDDGDAVMIGLHGADFERRLERHRARRRGGLGRLLDPPRRDADRRQRPRVPAPLVLQLHGRQPVGELVAGLHRGSTRWTASTASCGSAAA